MPGKKCTLFSQLLLIGTLLFATARADTLDHECLAANNSSYPTLLEAETARALGWVQSNENRCGGYYLEAPFEYPDNENLIQISSNEGILFSQRGTSISEGRITITRSHQQLIANKAYLYRNPETGKLSAIDLIDHVILREPNKLILAQTAHYDWENNAKLLHNILYRMAIYGDTKPKPIEETRKELSKERKITQLSAWGKAKTFKQNEPKVFEFEEATYSTCPPLTNSWQVRAKHIELDQASGRGYAKHASVRVKGIPVFYTPYLNFPIDDRRQTGFLWPIVGTSSKAGAYFAAPYYWNLAPNYDTTITPGILSKRGVQISDLFRYLTPKSEGRFNISILPADRAFFCFSTRIQ